MQRTAVIVDELRMITYDVGIKIHKLEHLSLHGKTLLADGVAAELTC